MGQTSSFVHSNMNDFYEGCKILVQNHTCLSFSLSLSSSQCKVRGTRREQYGISMSRFVDLLCGTPEQSFVSTFFQGQAKLPALLLRQLILEKGSGVQY